MLFLAVLRFIFELIVVKVDEKPRERPKNNISTSDTVTQTQLKKRHIQTWEDAMIEAKDRGRSRAIVQDPSLTTVCE